MYHTSIHILYKFPYNLPYHYLCHNFYGKILLILKIYRQVPSAPEGHFGPPESSYGPPPSGIVHSETHEDVHHSSQGHGAEIQTIQSHGQELQLPEIDSGSQFNNAIGFVSSTLGVSSGHNEVVQSHAVHESHTAEVNYNHKLCDFPNSDSICFNSQLTNNFNGGDSYAAPPLDSYAPGKYAPTFLQPRPHGPPQQPPQQHRPQPTPPAKVYLPQRPQSPRPQYIPPVPMKLLRPQGPPPNFRPQGNAHAHQIAQGYSSGQSHSQSIHSSGPVRQPNRPPLLNRPPVPQGLFQSIGQHVQALDNGQRNRQIGNTYLPPPTSELPIPPLKLMLPHPAPAQTFHHHQHQQQSHGSGSSASSSSSLSFQNQELRNVHVIHDCGKGPQLSQNYGPPSQPQVNQNFGPPSGPPALSYGTPLGKPLTSYGSPSQSQSHSQGLSSSYEIPAGSFEVPAYNSVDFNSQSNSYGPPASGPASLDVIGLESQQRANTVVSNEQQNIIAAASETQVSHEALPGLSNGLSGSGLNFISAQKSHSIAVPSQSGQTGNYQLQFVTSHSDHSNNRIDAPNHQQILADGLLQSILSAIEKQPTQTVPQVTEEQETDHSEVQVFLTSPQGQEVLADKQHVSKDEQHSS